MTLVILLISVGVIALGLVGAASSVRGVKKQLHEHANKLHEIAVTEIRDLVPGTLVRVLGVAVPSGETAIAPHSGRVCIAFDASLVARSSGPPYRTPSKSLDGSRIVPFLVSDDTGKVAVDIEHVELALATHLLESDGEQVKGFGDSILQRELRLSGNQTIEHWEHRLEVDHPVAVIGTVVRSNDGTLQLTGTAERPLVISNVKAAFEPDPPKR